MELPTLANALLGQVPSVRRRYRRYPVTPTLSVLGCQPSVTRASPGVAARAAGAVGAVRSRAAATVGSAAPTTAQRARAVNGRRRRRRGRAEIENMAPVELRACTAPAPGRWRGAHGAGEAHWL